MRVGNPSAATARSSPLAERPPSLRDDLAAVDPTDRAVRPRLQGSPQHRWARFSVSTAAGVYEAAHIHAVVTELPDLKEERAAIRPSSKT